MFQVGDKVKIIDTGNGWYGHECTVLPPRPGAFSDTGEWTWLVRVSHPGVPGVVKNTSLQRVEDKKITKFNVGQLVYINDTYPDKCNRGKEGPITDLPSSIGFYRVKTYDGCGFLLVRETEISKISSQNTFNPGDKVIAKKAEKIGTIKERYNRFGYPSVAFEEGGLEYGYHARDLELVKEEKPKFKVGDRVRSRNTSDATWQDCVVHSQYASPSALTGWFRVKNADGLHGAFNAESLELLPAIDRDSEDFKAGFDEGRKLSRELLEVKDNVKLLKIRRILDES